MGKHNKTDGKRKLLRLLEILNLLENQREILIKDLANRFQISIRSIQRDLNYIEMMNLPINRKKRGFVSFKEGFGLKNKSFNIKNKNSLLILKKLSKNLGPYVSENISNTIDSLIGQEKNDLEIVPIMPEMINKKGDNNIIDELNEAISFSHSLKINYSSFKKGTIEIKLNPIKVLFSEGFLYLLAFTKKNNYKVYRIDRIKNIEHLYDKTFSTPKNINKLIKSYNIWGIKKTNKINLKIIVYDWAIDFFKNFKIIHNQKVIENKDNSITFTGYIYQLEEILPFILKYLSKIKIIEPKILKEKINYLINKFLYLNKKNVRIKLRRQI